MPARALGTNQVSECLGSGKTRNYSYLYDKNLYASLWVAYPLTKSHTEGSASTSSWSYNPNIPQSYQVGVISASYPSLYNASAYSKGHQCPNADRKCSADMNAQTYYVTNQTPQLQNNFNASVWSGLETAVRGLTSSTDTVYVVTGPCYQTVGGSETITYLTAASGVSPSKVPVPNYYWKALLKVKRNSNGKITSACAVGFWFEHKAYTGTNYASMATSVDFIESKTGFDLFANLPDALESAAEQNASWSAFQNF